MGWHIVFIEDRFHRALGDACATVDALFWVDVNHGLIFVKTLHGANSQARFVFAPAARFGDHHCHVFILDSGSSTSELPIDCKQQRRPHHANEE